MVQKQADRKYEKLASVFCLATNRLLFFVRFLISGKVVSFIMAVVNMFGISVAAFSRSRLRLRFIFVSKHRFDSPAQPVRSFALSDLLDKPWSPVSSLLPPLPYLPSFLSRMGLAFSLFQHRMLFYFASILPNIRVALFVLAV